MTSLNAAGGRARVLVIQHESDAGPGHFGRWLENDGIDVVVLRPDLGDSVPSDLEGFAGLIVLGGSMGANDDDLHDWLGPTKALIRVAAVSGAPTLGICLGHQLASVALGGTIRTNHRGQQVGLIPTEWLAGADLDDDPLFGNLPRPRAGIHWNDDIVDELSPGARLLAVTSDGEPQVIRLAPSVWGVQLHPEVDADQIRSWADVDRDRQTAAGIDQTAVMAEMENAWPQLETDWAPVARRFADLARR